MKKNTTAERQIIENLFEECTASEYISCLNTFIRPRIENATKEERFDLYNIMKLIEVVSALERLHLTK